MQTRQSAVILAIALLLPACATLHTRDADREMVDIIREASHSFNVGKAFV